MPVVRLRRLRQKDFLRDWISETELHSEDFILPYFAVEGKGIKNEIKSMPGVYHLSVDSLLNDLNENEDIKSILLFGIPEVKDNAGSHAYRKDGIVQKTTKAIKKKFKDLVVITDVCLCSYMRHGHCGIVKGESMDNDETLKKLIKTALSHAEAGTDFIAPSAMMDGQVHAIRDALDRNGFKDVGILSYSAKYASNFYGPFRVALDSTPQFGDRKSYQMDFRNSHEALREIEEDIREGADIIMVKPALAYLDIIYRAKQKFNVPLAAYNVSGEYAMVNSWLMANDLQQKNKIYKPEMANSKSVIADNKNHQLKKNHQLRKNIVLEILTSIKRAGADLIITYHAKEAISWLKLDV